MAIADELIALLGFELTGEGAAKRYQSTLDGLTKRVEGFAKTAGIAAGIATTALVTGFTILGKSVLSTSAQFESYQATLETIEGSQEKAKASLDWIAGFAKKTPYDLAQVTESFVKLKAYGIDPIADDALRILGDTGSAMGKSLDQAVEAFADAATGEFERLKEFGIKAKTQGDDVTFSWTKNGKEMTKTVKKSSNEIRAFLLETMGDRFSGAMDKQSRTWNGMMSNLGDVWSSFQRKIGEKGFFENVSLRLKGLLDTLDQLDDNGTLDRWAENIGKTFSWVADTIWAIGTRIAENVAFLIKNWDKMKGTVQTLGIALGILVARLFPVWTALVLIGLAIDDFLAYLQGGESVIGDFIEWIKELTGVSDTVAQSLAGLGAVVASALGFAFLIAPLRTLTLFSSVLAKGILVAIAGARIVLVGAIAALGPVMSAALAGLSSAVSAGISAALFLLTNPIGWGILLAGAAAGLIYYFWDDLVAAWNGIAGQAKALFAQMKQWFLEIDWTGTGVAIMTAVWNGMKSIGGAIKEWFAGLFTMSNWMGPTAGFDPNNPPAALSTRPDYQANYGQGDPNALKTLADNATSYMDKMASGKAAETTLNDNRADNRQFPQTNNIEINQTVTTPAAAPGAAASATASAVQGAVAGQRAQIEQEPAF